MFAFQALRCPALTKPTNQLNTFMQTLTENLRAKKSIGRRDHDDPRWRLRYHFKAINRGKWDNFSWEKDDVGEYSNTYKDRHNFSSVSIRFKGEKSSRVIPVVIFRRFFKATVDMEMDPKKWTTADRGGTDIDYRPHADRTQLSKKEIKTNVKKADEPVKKEDVDLSTASLSEEVTYRVVKNGNKFELRKFMIPDSKVSLLVYTSEDAEEVNERKTALSSR